MKSAECAPTTRPVCYEGKETIDGVPGTSAPIPINFLNTAGSVCGALFPTGQSMERMDGSMNVKLGDIL
jgi:4-oxalomesaconate tautomerase